MTDDTQENTTTIEVPDDKLGVYSDWVANCRYGYGFGHTKIQAFATMAAESFRSGYLDSGDSPVEVTLTEHIGEATVSPGRTDVDWTLDGKVIKVNAKELHDFGKTSAQSLANIEHEGDYLLAEGEVEQTFEDGMWRFKEDNNGN